MPQPTEQEMLTYIAQGNVEAISSGLREGYNPSIAAWSQAVVSPSIAKLFTDHRHTQSYTLNGTPIASALFVVLSAAISLLETITESKPSQETIENIMSTLASAHSLAHMGERLTEARVREALFHATDTETQGQVKEAYTQSLMEALNVTDSSIRAGNFPLRNALLAKLNSLAGTRASSPATGGSSSAPARTLSFISVREMLAHRNEAGHARIPHTAAIALLHIRRDTYLAGADWEQEKEDAKDSNRKNTF